MSHPSEVSDSPDKIPIWKRAAPIAIVYFFMSSIYFFVTNILLYMLPIVVVQRKAFFDNPFIIGGLIAGTIALFAAVSLLRYYFYHFRLNESHLEIKQGLFKKSYLDLPFDKIQNVKIEQPFYYRPYDYAMVELETAGSHASEAKIVAMKLSQAESFKQKIMQIEKNGIEQSAEFNEAINQKAQREKTLNQRALLDLVIHGVTNNRVWIFLGAAAPFYETISENIGSVLSKMGFDVTAYLDYESLGVGLFLLHLLSVAMIIMLFLVLFSVLGSVLVFYDYRLVKLEDKYIRRSGLLNKQEVGMKKSRIQHVTQQQDWLDIVIGRANLKILQNSSGVVRADQSSLQNPSQLIVPSITPTESDALIKDIFNLSFFNQLNFKHVSRRLIYRYIIFPTSPILGIFALVLMVNSASIFAWFTWIGTGASMVFLCWLRWFRWGYCLVDDFVIIRSGLLGKNICIFSKQKIQQISLHQSVFMKRYKKANLSFVLASKAHKIPYIKDELALSLFDEGLLLVERDKPAWM